MQGWSVDAQGSVCGTNVLITLRPRTAVNSSNYSVPARAIAETDRELCSPCARCRLGLLSKGA